MSIRRMFAVPILAILLAGCEMPGGDGLIHQREHPLVGVWETVSMEVYLNATGDDPVRAISVDRGVWEDSFGLQPPEMHFSPEGYFETTYRAVDGTIVQRMSGHWLVNGDQVTLIQAQPEPARQTYTVSMPSDLQARFEGLVDWNSDGNVDDRYISINRKIGTTPRITSRAEGG